MEDPVKNKRVTVAGLGRFGGGITVAQWLAQQGARVLVTDQSDTAKLADSVRQLEGYPVEFCLGRHRMEDFTKADLVVASPALPPSNEYLSAARAAGVPVSTEIRLFLERCPLPVVAVSGTKGKSTTSKLLSLMLQQKYNCWLGGNIGKSLLFDLPKMKAGEIVLLELSSFMLEYLGEIAWRPHVALLTMLESDHLDWHGTQEAYLAAKRKLIEFQQPGDIAVLGENCPIAREFAAHTRAKIVWYGAAKSPRLELTIPGEHNQLNAQAALAAAGAMGVDRDLAQAAVADFPGLPHRMQLVCQRDGVKFVDDSIATIPAAAAAALHSFPRSRVLQIVGGRKKPVCYEVMYDALAEHAKAVLCIGESAGEIAAAMASKHPDYAAVHVVGDMAGAFRVINEIAASGDVVLLSTGCASYDQFDNFEKRGERFVQLAEAFRI